MADYGDRTLPLRHIMPPLPQVASSEVLLRQFAPDNWIPRQRVPYIHSQTNRPLSMLAIRHLVPKIPYGPNQTKPYLTTPYRTMFSVPCGHF